MAKGAKITNMQMAKGMIPSLLLGFAVLYFCSPSDEGIYRVREELFLIYKILILDVIRAWMRAAKPSFIGKSMKRTLHQAALVALAEEYRQKVNCCLFQGVIEFTKGTVQIK